MLRRGGAAVVAADVHGEHEGEREAYAFGGDGVGRGWQADSPAWVPLLVEAAGGAPTLWQGPPVQALLEELAAACETTAAGSDAAARRRGSGGSGGSGAAWWLDAASALLVALSASASGRRALLQRETGGSDVSRLTHASLALLQLAVDAGGAGHTGSKV